MQSQSLKILEGHLHNLGFADIYSFASNQAKLFTLGKIEEYKIVVRFFEKRYKMSFEIFNKELKKNKVENFDKEDDLMEWRYATEAISMFEKELKALQKC